jgi:hypothetical protein
MSQPRVKGEMKDAVMTEESVVSKVKELMETLDHIKKYNALTHSLKRFALIVGGSITVFLFLVMLFDFFGLRLTLDRSLFLVAGFLLLLIPVLGIAAGILFVRRSVSSVKTGEWKEELSHGFPSALKVLSELDWDKVLNEIVMGKLGYVVYGLLKTAAYWFVVFFGLNLLWNAITFYFLNRMILLGDFVWALFALLIVLFVLSKDLLRRYKEIQALDMLLLELRWLNFEFRRAEFQT